MTDKDTGPKHTTETISHAKGMSAPGQGKAVPLALLAQPHTGTTAQPQARHAQDAPQQAPARFRKGLWCHVVYVEVLEE